MDNLNPSDISSSPIPSPQRKKTFFKHWSGVVVLVILAALVTWGLLNLPTIINAVQGKLTAWKYERELRELEKPYREDKIGGETPEETFDMFIDALKKEDVEVASKYFVIHKQDDWRESFGKLQGNADYYNAMILELEF